MSMRYDPFSRAAVDSYYESLQWAPEDAVIERSERSRKQEIIACQSNLAADWGSTGTRWEWSSINENPLASEVCERLRLKN